MHTLIPNDTLVTVTFFAIPKLFIRGLVRTQKTTLHNLKLRLFENTPFKESKKFFVQHPPNDAQGPDLHLCLFA